jgi:hypothetical protein
VVEKVTLLSYTPTMTTAAPHRQTLSPTPSYMRRKKVEGNISAVFACIAGGDSALPAEYARFKREIVDTPFKEQAIVDNFRRLLTRLQELNTQIANKGNSVGIRIGIRCSSC